MSSSSNPPARRGELLYQLSGGLQGQSPAAALLLAVPRHLAVVDDDHVVLDGGGLS